MKGGRRQRHGGGGFPSAQAAADARADALHRHRRGALPDIASGRLTLGGWLPIWLEGRGDELRSTTLATYRHLIRKHIAPALGDLRLAEIRGSHLTAAYKQMAQRVSPSTVARIHAVVSGALKAARQEEIIGRNPAENAKLPRRTRLKVRPWSPAELGRFLEATRGERLLPLYVLAAFTGLRRGELCGLQWGDVDLEREVLVVRRQRVVVDYVVQTREEAKTAAGQRVVWLDRATVATLRAWRKRQAQERLALGEDYHQPGTWVFTDEAGYPPHPESVTTAFRRLGRRLGLPAMKLHGLRHYRAASLISVGESVEVVSKLMGHSSVTVTSQVYGSLFEQAGRAAGERAAALVSVPDPRHTPPHHGQLSMAHPV